MHHFTTSSHKDTNKRTCLPCLNDERGSILIIAVFTLLLLTTIGIFATNTSNVELMISGNERVYQQNFYRAEGSAMLAMQTLRTETEPEELMARTTTIFAEWLQYYTTAADMSTIDNWDVDGNSTTAESRVLNGEQIVYSAIHNGVAGGFSLDLSTGTRVNDYSIFGLGDRNNGCVIIEMGYRKRF